MPHHYLARGQLEREKARNLAESQYRHFWQKRAFDQAHDSALGRPFLSAPALAPQPLQPDTLQSVAAPRLAPPGEPVRPFIRTQELSPAEYGVPLGDLEFPGVRLQQAPAEPDAPWEPSDPLIPDFLERFQSEPQEDLGFLRGAFRSVARVPGQAIEAVGGAISALGTPWVPGTVDQAGEGTVPLLPPALARRAQALRQEQEAALGRELTRDELLATYQQVFDDRDPTALESFGHELSEMGAETASKFPVSEQLAQATPRERMLEHPFQTLAEFGPETFLPFAVPTGAAMGLGRAAQLAGTGARAQRLGSAAQVARQTILPVQGVRELGLTYTESYNRQRQAGAPHGLATAQAAVQALATAAGNTALEVVPMLAFLDNMPVPGLGKVFAESAGSTLGAITKGAAKAAAIEGVEEVVQEGWSAVSAHVFGKDPAAWDDFAYRALEAGWLGAWSGAPLGAYAGGIGHKDQAAAEQVIAQLRDEARARAVEEQIEPDIDETVQPPPPDEEGPETPPGEEGAETAELEEWQTRVLPVHSEGSLDIVHFQGRQDRPKARFAFVEAEDVFASETADLTAQPEGAYPAADTDAQGRDYSDPHELAKATRRLDPALVTGTGVEASTGPPVVTPSGVVVAGNGRTIIIQREMRAGGRNVEEYRARLAEQAQSLGLDPAVLEGMKAPMLVRVLQPSEARDWTDAGTLAELNRQSDISGTMGKGVAQSAVTRARALSERPDLMTQIADIPEGKSISEWLDTGGGQQFVRDLFKAGVFGQTEEPNILETTRGPYKGSVLPAGREQIAGVIRQLILEDPTIAKHMPRVLARRLSTSWAPVLKAKLAHSGFDLGPLIAAAATQIKQVKDTPQIKSLSQLGVQQGMALEGQTEERFAAENNMRSFVNAFAQILDTSTSGDLRAKFEEWAAAALFDPEVTTGQDDVFSELGVASVAESPTEAFARIFGLPGLPAPDQIADLSSIEQAEVSVRGTQQKVEDEPEQEVKEEVKEEVREEPEAKEEPEEEPAGEVKEEVKEQVKEEAKEEPKQEEQDAEPEQEPGEEVKEEPAQEEQEAKDEAEQEQEVNEFSVPDVLEEAGASRLADLWGASVEGIDALETYVTAIAEALDKADRSVVAGAAEALDLLAAFMLNYDAAVFEEIEDPRLRSSVVGLAELLWTPDEFMDALSDFAADMLGVEDMVSALSFAALTEVAPAPAQDVEDVEATHGSLDTALEARLRVKRQGAVFRRIRLEGAFRAPKSKTWLRIKRAVLNRVLPNDAKWLNARLRALEVQDVVVPLKAWTDLTGVKVRDAEHMYRLVRGFSRNLNAEVSSVYYLDGEGVILGRSIQSYGEVSTAPTVFATGRNEFRGNRLPEGTAEVILVHNHPIGDSKPSRGDIAVQLDVQAALDKHGVKSSFLVINSDNYSTIRGGRVERRTLADLPAHPQHDVPANWQLGVEAVIRSGKHKPGKLGFVFLDAYMRVVAYENHPPALAGAADKAAEWVHKRMKALGGENVVIIADDRKAVAAARGKPWSAKGFWFAEKAKYQDRLSGILGYVDISVGPARAAALAKQGRHTPAMEDKPRAIEGMGLRNRYHKISHGFEPRVQKAFRPSDVVAKLRSPAAPGRRKPPGMPQHAWDALQKVRRTSEQEAKEQKIDPETTRRALKERSRIIKRQSTEQKKERRRMEVAGAAFAREEIRVAEAVIATAGPGYSRTVYLDPEAKTELQIVGRGLAARGVPENFPDHDGPFVRVVLPEKDMPSHESVDARGFRWLPATPEIVAELLSAGTSLSVQRLPSALRIINALKRGATFRLDDNRDATVALSWQDGRIRHESPGTINRRLAALLRDIGYSKAPVHSLARILAHFPVYVKSRVDFEKAMAKHAREHLDQPGKTRLPVEGAGMKLVLTKPRANTAAGRTGAYYVSHADAKGEPVTLPPKASAADRAVAVAEAERLQRSLVAAGVSQSATDIFARTRVGVLKDQFRAFLRIISPPDVAVDMSIFDTPAAVTDVEENERGTHDPSYKSKLERRVVKPHPDDSAERKKAIEEANQSQEFAPYRARVRRRTPHPSVVVETRALAGMAPPRLTAEIESPVLDDLWGHKDPAKNVSDEQADMIRSVTSAWANGHGALIAADVGVGKTRVFIGTLLEAIEQGAQRMVFVTKNASLADAFEREWKALTGKDGPAHMVNLQKLPGTDVPPAAEDGRPTIYIATAASAQAVPEWFAQLGQQNIDAFIADEAHVFKNLSSGRGKAWSDLHARMIRENTRIAYGSATPGVRLQDLAYLYGLRVWPVGRFASWVSWMRGYSPVEPDPNEPPDPDARTEAGLGGSDYLPNVSLGETEQVMRELKGRGRYVSVDLWRGDVDFAVQRVEVRDEDAGHLPGWEGQGTASEAWDRSAVWLRDIMSAIEDARGNDARRPRMGAVERGQLQAWRKQFLFTLKLRELARIANETIAGGKQAVISVHNVTGDLTGTDPDAPSPQQRLAEVREEAGDVLAAVTEEQVREAMNVYSPDDPRPGRVVKVLHDFPAKIDAYIQFLENDRQGTNPLLSRPVETIEDLPPAFNQALGPAVQETIAAWRAAESEVGIEKLARRLQYALRAIEVEVWEKKMMGGEPVFIFQGIDQQALAARTRLLEQALNEMPLLPDPLVYLRDEIGADKVAFITGSVAGKTVDPEARTEAEQAFQSGAKPVAVISKAGKEGINLHDVNGRQRVMLVADYEWSADTVKQELGRVDRTGQQSSPQMRLVVSNFQLEMRFASSVQARMRSLGSTSKGAATSTGTEALDEFDMRGAQVLSALRLAYAHAMTEAERRQFSSKMFKIKHPDDPDMWIPAKFANEQVQANHALTDMLFMNVETAEKFLRAWQNANWNLRAQHGGERTFEGTLPRAGRIVSITKLAEEQLILIRARGNDNKGLALVVGSLAPFAHRIRSARADVRGDPTASLRNTFIQFTENNSRGVVSGLLLNQRESAAVEQILTRGQTEIWREDDPEPGAPSAAQERANEGIGESLATLMDSSIREPNRRSDTLDADPGPARKPYAETEFVEDVINVLHIAGEKMRVYYGRIYRDAAGWFNYWTHELRVRRRANARTHVHELGHALDMLLFGYKAGEKIGTRWTVQGRGPTFTPDMRAELLALGKALYGNKKPKGGYANEGFAEYIVAWVRSPDSAAEHAPTFHGWFQEQVKDREDFHDAVAKLSRSWAKLRALDPNARGRRNLRTKAEVKERQRAHNLKSLKSFRSFITRFVDATYDLTLLRRAVEQLSGKTIPAHVRPDDWAAAMRMTAPGRAARAVFAEMVDMSGRAVQRYPSLAQALRPLFAGRTAMSPKEKEEIFNDFQMYLVARRTVADAAWALEHRRKARDTGMAIEDAKEIVAERHADEDGKFAGYREAAGEVYSFFDGVLTYVAEASPHMAYVVNNIRENDPGSYVPLLRELDPETTQTSRTGSSGALHRRHGSDRPVIMPLESAYRVVANMMQAAHVSRLIDNVVSLARMEGSASAGITRISRPVQMQGPFTVAEVLAAARAQLAKHKVELELEGTDDAVLAALDEHVRFYRPKGKDTGPDAILHVVNGAGKVEWYQVPPGVLDAVEGIGRWEPSGIVSRLASAGTDYFRTMTTGIHGPFALLTNATRDLFTSFLNTRMDSKEHARAIAQTFKEDFPGLQASVYTAVGGALATGGAFTFLAPAVAFPVAAWTVSAFLLSGPVAVGVQRARERRGTRKMGEASELASNLGLRQSLFLTRRQDPGFDVFNRLLREAGRAAEQPAPKKLGGMKVHDLDPRKLADPKEFPSHVRRIFYAVQQTFSTYEEFFRIAALRAYMNDKDIKSIADMTLEQAVEGTWHYRNITTDFTRSGTTMREVSPFLPYVNAAIQGKVTLVRTVRDQPKKALAHLGGWLALSMAMMLLHRDEEWWRNLNPGSKMRYQYIPFVTPAGTRELARIATPHDIGPLAMLPALVADALWEKEGWNAQRTALEFLDLMSPVTTPFPTMFGVTPLLEAGMNKDFFYKRPIESKGMQRFKVTDRYDQHTPPTTKMIAKALGISPAKLEHVSEEILGRAAAEVTRSGESIMAALRGEAPFDLSIGYAGSGIIQRGGRLGRSGYGIYSSELWRWHQRLNETRKDWEQPGGWYLRPAEVTLARGFVNAAVEHHQRVARAVARIPVNSILGRRDQERAAQTAIAIARTAVRHLSARETDWSAAYGAVLAHQLPEDIAGRIQSMADRDDGRYR